MDFPKTEFPVMTRSGIVMVPENTAPVVSNIPAGPWGPVAPMAPALPVAPVAPWIPWVPWVPWIPWIPWSPWGPLNAPTSTHPSANVELILEATHRLLPITYPSPMALVVGNKPVFANAPLITIVPGATPPILEPTGIETPPSVDEIVAPPIAIELAPQLMWFT